MWYNAEEFYEWRGLSPQLSAWPTQCTASNSDEMMQQWRAVGDPLSDLTCQGIDP